MKLMSSEVPDGATQRHSRLMELLTFINSHEPEGCTLTSIQAHMLTTFGLKFKTTAEMVRELSLAGIIKVDGIGRFHLTEKQRLAMETLKKRERKEKAIFPLLKRIDQIEDAKKRDKALKLLNRLLKLLPEE